MIPSRHLVDRVAECYDGGGGGGSIAAATEAEIALFAATYVSPVQPAGSSLCTLCGTVIRNRARIRGGRLGGVLNYSLISFALGTSINGVKANFSHI